MHNNCPVWTSLHNNQKFGTTMSATDRLFVNKYKAKKKMDHPRVNSFAASAQSQLSKQQLCIRAETNTLCFSPPKKSLIVMCCVLCCRLLPLFRTRLGLRRWRRCCCLIDKVSASPRPSFFPIVLPVTVLPPLTPPPPPSSSSAMG